jgi:predicted permease
VNTLPMSQDEGIALRAAPENAPEDTPRSAIAAFLMATPGYFAALGTPLRGEDLPATFDSTRRVAVINEAMAKTLWPDEDAIGKRLVSAFGNARTVVGIIANVRTARLDAAPEPQVYFPMAESPQHYLAIVARGSMGTDALIARIREAVRAVDSRQPVYATRTLEDVVSASIAPRRVNALLLTVFGGVALALAAIGVYAVLAYNVAQRTREFGVRVALGAQRIDVISLVLSRGVVLATTGIAIGLAGAYALSRYLGSILYETTAHDPRVFIGAPVILLAIALLATWLPARRATRIDPMEALREG